MVTLLEQLHSTGYVHSDLKPENICVGEYDDWKTLHEVKLIDFELAKPFREGSKHISEIPVETFVGNLAFCSPGAASHVTVCRRDDLLSLFLILIYLRTGRIHGSRFKDDKPRFKAYRASIDVKEVCRKAQCHYLKDFVKTISKVGFT